MNLNSNRWSKLFLFGLGLSVGSAFCMKWLEAEFFLGGEKFGVIGLEIFYPKERVQAILAGVSDHTRSLLQYQLYFDFAFMAGIYPAIVALCMMAKNKLHGRSGKIMFILAWLQTLAWVADINENLFLLRWIHLPVIGKEFGLYHMIVYTKWVIALTGFFAAVVILLFNRNKRGKLFS